MSTAPDPQRRVQTILDDAVASGRETGLQVTVLHQGHTVVDASSGVSDPSTARPVEADTLFFAASTGKGIATSVAHVLVERGELDYDQRVAEVWPEFAAHGKDHVTLHDVLLHTVGVPGLWARITPEDLTDWDRMCSFVAAEKPWWPPGSATAITR